MTIPNKGVQNMFAKFMKTRKRSKLPFQVLVNGELKDDFIYSGNQSMPLDTFKVKRVASLYCCVVCNKVPSSCPVESSCCSSIYCQEECHKVSLHL